MKPAASILVVLMFFFTAQPLLVYCQPPVQLPVSKTGCCKSSGTCHKKEKTPAPVNRDCNGASSCNPFASCSQCQYVAAYRITYNLSRNQADRDEMTIRNENIVPGYLSDCWHPPEFV